MKKIFNITGACRPDRHYMVELKPRLEKIKRMIDAGDYMTLSRPRQYGKTTTLRMLAGYLETDYLVISLDFQRISQADFVHEAAFVHALAREFGRRVRRMQEVPDTVKEELADFADRTDTGVRLADFFDCLSGWCGQTEKPIVLLIDEVDTASDHQVFLDFLAQLRAAYLDRDEMPAFQSVILAGLYDIKNLKLRIRPDSERKYNSPWNIAAKLPVDLSFSKGQIAAMLEEYESDRQTGMDVQSVADEIRQYTAGYPYLVCAVCKYLDEEIPGRAAIAETETVWSGQGIAEAVKLLLNERVPLFESMVKQLDLYPKLRSLIRQVLYQGIKIPYSPAEESVNLGRMFGFLRDENGWVVIANRMFEMYLLHLFISEESVKSAIYKCGERDRNQFVKNGRLNMRLVLEKFVIHFTDIYGGNEEKFLEENGRRFFLLYLKPIINGTGNYYLEAQTRDARRTDVIVDYSGEQFIVELKIWHGNEYHERGENQLIEYLDDYHLDTGYLLSFNFNKKKEIGVKELRVRGKRIVEAVV